MTWLMPKLPNVHSLMHPVLEVAARVSKSEEAIRLVGSTLPTARLQRVAPEPYAESVGIAPIRCCRCAVPDASSRGGDDSKAGQA